MVGIDWADASLSFTTGLIAAINPCGFVLLPTYLLYFLGMEAGRADDQRTSIGRALKVGGAVSAGFLLVFLVIGAITRWQSTWFQDKAPWIALVVAVLMVILGLAMLVGYRLPFTTPKMSIGRKDRSVRSMFVFGVAYAVASIGCTLGPFITRVLAGITRSGFLTGLINFALYALAMGLVVIGLTVSLAMANRWLLGVLRKGMQHVETVAGVVVLLSGVYLFWYWYTDLNDQLDDRVTAKALGWQARLENFVQRNETVVVVLLGAMIVAALGLVAVKSRRSRTS